MKSWLKLLYYKFKYRAIKVKLSGGVILDSKNVFEGHNSVGNGTEVASSSIGFGTYISERSVIRKARIGRFCSVGSNVQTGVGRHPVSEFVSTHPAFFSTQEQAGFTFTSHNIFKEHIFVDRSPNPKYVVDIGNDVWIGSNVIIMDGITIADGAIVAAGAVVTKNVEPYTIVGGIPAKTIKTRFTPQQIEGLLNIKWWLWDINYLKEKAAGFANVQAFIDSQTPVNL
jgi:acetyltransferase-like isoleucine patch superfamily enzyme